MERQKRPYSIQKRPAVKHRHIYYAKFRDAAGNYHTAVSTGCRRIDDAVRWCEARLRKSVENTDSITLAEYAQGFWEPTAAFATDRAAHGRAVSLTHLDIARGTIAITSCPPGEAGGFATSAPGSSTSGLLSCTAGAR
jgi:hypothetical protein